MNDDFLGGLHEGYGSYFGPDRAQKTMITRREWDLLRQKYPAHLPEGITAEEAGFKIYYTAEQLDLLMRLKKRWGLT